MHPSPPQVAASATAATKEDPQVAASATAATKEEVPSPPQMGVMMSRTMRRHDAAAYSKEIAGDAGGNVAPAKQLKAAPVASAPIT